MLITNNVYYCVVWNSRKNCVNRADRREQLELLCSCVVLHDTVHIGGAAHTG